MHQIRPWIFIGTRRDARNPGILHRHGIGAVLQLAVPIECPGIATKFLPVEDAEPVHPERLREALDFVLAEKEAGCVVLIACAGGFSRSPAFAAAVLKEAECLGLDAALAVVLEAHPDAQPHPALGESLCMYYGEGRSGSRGDRYRHRRNRSPDGRRPDW